MRYKVEFTKSTIKQILSLLGAEGKHWYCRDNLDYSGKIEEFDIGYLFVDDNSVTIGTMSDWDANCYYNRNLLVDLDDEPETYVRYRDTILVRWDTRCEFEEYYLLFIGQYKAILVSSPDSDGRVVRLSDHTVPMTRKGAKYSDVAEVLAKTSVREFNIKR